MSLRWDDTHPGPEQPRKHFDEVGVLQLPELLRTKSLGQNHWGYPPRMPAREATLGNVSRRRN